MSQKWYTENQYVVKFDSSIVLIAYLTTNNVGEFTLLQNHFKIFIIVHIF